MLRVSPKTGTETEVNDVLPIEFGFFDSVVCFLNFFWVSDFYLFVWKSPRTATGDIGRHFDVLICLILLKVAEYKRRLVTPLSEFAE